MSCEKFETLLLHYLDQELDAREALSVQHHLEECVHCSEKLQEIRTMREAVTERAFPDPAFFEDARRVLFQKIRASRPSSEKTFVLRGRPRWVPVFSTFLLIGVLMGLWLLPGRYQAFTLRQDLAELVALETLEQEALYEVYPEADALLEEELQLVEEFIVLAEAEELNYDAWLTEELELLNALGEAEELEEEDWENLEEELTFIEEETVG